MSNYTVFSDLVGKTITSIVGGQGDEQLTIETGDDKIYRISTAKGLVVIRWYGASDYYSTRVDFVEM